MSAEFTLFTIVCAFCFLFAKCEAKNLGNIYSIGVGIGDITGPAAEVNMMGYAKLGQSTSGIHTRQYARAFVIADTNSRFVFVSMDSCMASQILYLEVVKALHKKYGNMYTAKNVCLSGTHTHSGPGGFLEYALYIVTSQGFVRQSLDAIVNGVVASIEMAHKNMQYGYLFLNKGDLFNSSINRSPTAYLNNPPEERAKYKMNVDTEMVLLKMTDLQGKPIGMINWFPVHCTSMNNTNVFINSDNKGYASLLFEQYMNNNSIHGQGPFVAAFAQANEGDVSPNTKGPKCIDTGLPCDLNSSTCNGSNEKCIAFGPGKDMFESTQIIGYKQYEKAMELFDSANIPVSGPVVFSHRFVDMSNVIVPLSKTKNATTCKPAMGYSFAAGTTDGPGGFDFKQGTKSSSLFWNLVRDLINTPSAHLQNCQAPKPILLATGEMNFPYAWQPAIVPTQILKIGQLAIVAVPAEFTTMSGRRTKNAVKEILDSCDTSKDNEVVIAGLSNTYSSYVATFEEYQVQRYEAASTIFGPHTLQAYIQQYVDLAKSICTGKPVDSGPQPPNLLDKQISLLPGVILDTPYFAKSFGDVVSDANSNYTPGQTVMVSFISGHPRNDLQTNGTFLTVERQDPDTRKWTIIATDSNWETKYYWKRTNSLLGHSEALISWDIPKNTPAGIYRIKHFGHSKSILQTISSYVGTSRNFVIKNC